MAIYYQRKIIQLLFKAVASFIPQLPYYLGLLGYKTKYVSASILRPKPADG